LQIDYSQFKHIPRVERDEFYGIEKGYENCIDLLNCRYDPVAFINSLSNQNRRYNQVNM